MPILSRSVTTHVAFLSLGISVLGVIAHSERTEMSCFHFLGTVVEDRHILLCIIRGFLDNDSHLLYSMIYHKNVSTIVFENSLSLG